MQVERRFHNETDGYRYGFQGQERDDELKGEGNSLNYTFRMHDPRIGRFFSIDPLEKDYPYYTPYSFSGNKPIQFVELEGLEEATTTFTFTSIKGKSKYQLVDASLTMDNTKKRNEVIFMKVDGEKYRANSYQTTQGRDGRNSSTGNFSGVIKLTDRDLSAILGYSDFVFEYYSGSRSKEQTVINESNAGLWKSENNLLDFKNVMYNLLGEDSNKLIAIDGVLYNPNEAGNYIWGMVLEEAGVLINANNIAEWGTRGRQDEPHEQKAITKGRQKAKSLNVNAHDRSVTFDIYTADYREHLQEHGSEVYIPSDSLGDRKDAIDNTPK